MTIPRLRFVPTSVGWISAAPSDNETAKTKMPDEATAYPAYGLKRARYKQKDLCISAEVFSVDTG